MSELEYDKEFDTESGENEEDLKTESYSDAVLWGTDWTTETILNQLTKGHIDLDPNFQRRDAWNKKRKSKFIESLILGLPIPQIILAEKKEKRGTYIVIDGKQRLLSIRQFFSKDDNDKFTKLELSGLEILDKLNGISGSELEKQPSHADSLSSIQNQSIRTIVIRNWPNERFLYTVFLRLNTGSLQLSPQELRKALHPGPFMNFVDDYAIESEGIKTILNLKKPDYRMRDVELIIRYCAWKYLINSYTGNLKAFFDDTVKHLNCNWKTLEPDVSSNITQLEDAIKLTIEIFGTKEAFSKWYDKKFQGNFNRAIFDVMIYYFSFPEVRKAAESKYDEIVNGFKKLCESDNTFLSSFETSTKNIKQTKKRFSTWGDFIKNNIYPDVSIPSFESD